MKGSAKTRFCGREELWAICSFKQCQAPSGSSTLILPSAEGNQHSTDFCHLFWGKRNWLDFIKSLRQSGRLDQGVHNFIGLTKQFMWSFSVTWNFVPWTNFQGTQFLCWKSVGGGDILYQGFNFERFHMTSLEEKDPTQLIKLKTHIRISTCSSDIYYRLIIILQQY